MKDKTTRREPCRRTYAIEPRIRPLVSALNATGLVTTFSSCEGHFGRVDKEPLNVREGADVRFEPNAGVREAELEALFGHVIGDHVNSPTLGSGLSWDSRWERDSASPDAPPELTFVAEDTVWATF
mgnify:CR=1 FL=1